MISLFAAAFFIGRVLQIRRDKLIYFVAVFVFFPFNFYLATQALPEIFILFLIAAIHYLLLVPPINYKKVILLAMISAVLISQRPNYILLLPLIPLLFYFVQREKALTLSVSFVVVAVLSCSIALVFEGHLIKSPSITDTIINNVHGVSNMGNFFDQYDHAKVSLGDLMVIVWDKIGGAMKTQFAFSGLSAFMFYLINLMLLSIPMLFYQRKMMQQKHLVCLVFIGIHFMTVILFFNQYRYAAAIIPSLFILCISMFRNWNRSIFKGLLFRSTLLLGCLAVSIAIGWQVRKQAIAEKIMISEVQNLTVERKFTALMCGWNNGGGLAIGYAMSPKNVYFFPPNISLDAWFSTANKLQTQSGMINSKSKLYQKLKPYMVYEKMLVNGDFTYFEVGSQKN